MDKTLTHRAYEHVRRKLLHGELKPGARLRYGPIGKEIGISATPVREAMGMLAAEGLVRLVPELGAVVRTLDHDEAVDLYQMREALESSAAGWAAEKIGAAELKELESLLKRIRLFGVTLRKSKRPVMPDSMQRQYAATDMAFHMVILQATGNQALLKVVSDYHVLSRVFAGDPTRYDLSMVARAYLDHARILRALQRRDAAGARQAMEQHIRNAWQMVLAGLERGRRQERWSLLHGQTGQSYRVDASAAESQPPQRN
jgi:DNA-binding GntR family transcriptional regulator